ncbi:hypothetical protein GEMRC1_010888 [Eukaryota sp. GEM-RC1]
MHFVMIVLSTFEVSFLYDYDCYMRAYCAKLLCLHEAYGSYLVRIDERYRSCSGPKHLGFPCPHFAAVCRFLGKSHLSYVSEFFTIQYYRETYRYGMYPIQLSEDMEHLERILPPLYSKKTGRRKKKRYRSNRHGRKEARKEYEQDIFDKLMISLREIDGGCESEAHQNEDVVEDDDNEPSKCEERLMEEWDFDNYVGEPSPLDRILM